MVLDRRHEGNDADLLYLSGPTSCLTLSSRTQRCMIRLYAGVSQGSLLWTNAEARQLCLTTESGVLRPGREKGMRVKQSGASGVRRSNDGDDIKAC